ncbi:hypothetical protein [Streptomyces sp. MK5]|uniref:hypothetical protein n=1 Tax=Streptomyces sp. MK5 TaxID=3064253 RepID=UPI00274059DE|nr:hypothetical protein [Streptomyces sp. MK5]
MTKDQAVAAAARYLKALAYPDRADSVITLPDLAEEFPYGWTVRFDCGLSTVQRSAMPGGTTHSVGWPVREAIISKSPS